MRTLLRAGLLLVAVPMVVVSLYVIRESWLASREEG